MNKIKRQHYINIIDEYHEIIGDLRDKYEEWDSITEYDSVYQDILDYQEDRFYRWKEKDFIELIDYLNRLSKEGK